MQPKQDSAGSFDTKIQLSSDTRSYIRSILFCLLSIAVVVYIETGRRAGADVPIPFLLLYASSIFAAYLGGRNVGIISGLSSSGFVIYASTINFGPPTLTGGIIQVGMGILLYLLSPLLMGRIVDQKRQLQKKMLEQKQILEDMVDKRSNELQGLTQNLLEKNAQLQHAEERYRLLFNNTLEAIIVHRDGKVLEINPSYEALSGFSYDEIIGTSIYKAIPKAERELVEARIKAGFEQPYESQLKHRDGSILSVAYHAREIIYEGEKARIVAIRDLTEQKAYEKQELELALHRERVNLLEEVVSDLSHDIKTPLTGIKTTVHLLRRNPEEQERYLSQLDQQVERLNKLVDDILAISRLDKGARLTFEAISIDKLNDNIRSILNDFRHRFVEKQIDFNEQFESSNLEVMFNETEMMRAIVNLIENALSYTAKNGSIKLVTKLSDTHFLICVSDTGIGIAESEQERVFERFYRTEKARSTSEAGTGLGLAITSRIVELHGGRIELESVLGKGSAFTIYLPLFFSG